MLELQLKFLSAFYMACSYKLILPWKTCLSGGMVLFGTYINLISEITKRFRAKLTAYNGNGARQIKTYGYIIYTIIIYPKKNYHPNNISFILSRVWFSNLSRYIWVTFSLACPKPSLIKEVDTPLRFIMVAQEWRATYMVKGKFFSRPISFPMSFK